MADTGGTPRTTLFQLEALASAVRHRSYAAAAAEMGIADKHRLIRAVERLAEHVGLDVAANRVDDEPFGLEPLVDSAQQILAAVHEFERAAALLNEQPVLLRCIALPSMVYIFLARAVAEYEAAMASDPTEPDVSIRFVELDSRYRKGGGSHMLEQLVAGVADLAIVPTTSGDPGPNLEKRHLYDWRLVAAVPPSHPVLSKKTTANGESALPVEALVGYPLLVSPAGHRSHEMLFEHEPPQGLTIELATTNSMARAALGGSGTRVPIVASDAIPQADFRNDWPAITVGGRYLTSGHDLYWRKDLPELVQAALDAFALWTFDAAEILRRRPGGRA